MSEREAELLEALRRAQRLKERADIQRREAELLLTGTSALLEATSPDDMYKRMFEVFRTIIPYDISFVLNQQSPGHMACTSSTHPDLLASVWKVDSVFKRAVLGQPCAVYDISRQPSWSDHLAGIYPLVESALYCPFSGPGVNAILVFCHSKKGFYIQSHSQIAEKYKAFMEQMLLSMHAKLQALESQGLRDKKEQAEKGMMQSEKMASLGLLAAGVAHEITNPISFVASNINYLSTSIDDIKDLYSNFGRLLDVVGSDHDDAAKNLADEMIAWQRAVDIEGTLTDMDELVVDCGNGLSRVREIVGGLRNFIRTDEKSSVDVDVNDCIESTLKIVSNELKYHCTIDTQLQSVTPVICNIGKLNQVITNLLVNAGQAIEDKGIIRIRSGVGVHATVGSCVWFLVEDNGCGIARQNLGRIFEPFYTTKEVGKGTGLGLAISYSIIEKMGGVMEVESELNKGTSFTVYLPSIL